MIGLSTGGGGLSDSSTQASSGGNSKSNNGGNTINFGTPSAIKKGVSTTDIILAIGILYLMFSKKGRK